MSLDETKKNRAMQRSHNFENKATKKRIKLKKMQQGQMDRSQRLLKMRCMNKAEGYVHGRRKGAHR